MTFKKLDATIEFVIGTVFFIVGFLLSFYPNGPFKNIPHNAMYTELGNGIHCFRHFR